MLSPEGLEVSFDEPASKGTKDTSHSVDHGDDYIWLVTLRNYLICKAKHR